MGDTDTLVGYVSESLGDDLGAPSRIAGRFELQALLGRGGMGSVYRAIDCELAEVVAVKVLLPELMERPGMIDRFRSEVKLARRVTHPNVVRTFDLGEDGETRFLTMEYVPGRPLSDVLAAEGALPPHRALRIAEAIASGLAAAHAAGVLHRDLKPDNVLIGVDGRVAISDFGVARAALGLGGRGGRLIGTPAYIAPEQVLPDRPVDARADQYALGAVLYEMLTGRRAWEGPDPLTVALTRVTKAAPDPRDIESRIPKDVAELVLRMMHGAPADRFEDVEAVRAALAEIRGTTEGAGVELPVAASAEPLAVAALPFRAAEADRDLADGLAEEIVDLLSMAEGLRVRPFASTPADDPRAAGRALGVDAVIHGTLRRAGDTLRIGIRVLEVQDGYQLWARRYTAAPEAVLALSDEMAAQVAEALSAALDRPQRSVDANGLAVDLYLRGRALLRRGWAVRVSEAISLFDQAVELVPDEPRFLAARATARARSAFMANVGHDALLERAREDADRAVVLGPGLPEPWLALTHVHFYLGDSAAAARAVREVLARAPGLTRAQLVDGILRFEADDLDGARGAFARVRSLDPDAQEVRWELARMAAYDDDWDAVARELAGAGEGDMARIGLILTQLRLAPWRGELPDVDLSGISGIGPGAQMARSMAELSMAVIERRFPLNNVEAAARSSLVGLYGRQRWVRAQFIIEGMVWLERADFAWVLLGEALDHGLQDLCWMRRCPVLAPLREFEGWAERLARVEERASEVLSG